jgi:hypothetical protein
VHDFEHLLGILGVVERVGVMIRHDVSDDELMDGWMTIRGEGSECFLLGRAMEEERRGRGAGAPPYFHNIFQCTNSYLCRYPYKK